MDITIDSVIILLDLKIKSYLLHFKVLSIDTPPEVLANRNDG